MHFLEVAQLAFVFLIVILIVNATPVRSIVILDFTKDEGVIVGNGPAVSDGVTEQSPEDDPEPEDESVLVEESDETSSLLHELMIGIAKDEIPIKPKPLKNSFLFIAFIFKCYTNGMINSYFRVKLFEIKVLEKV
ncbi:hypothetical protein ACQ9BO_02280 [Flavobacterium sp. P21]|uniref:hypothetical protein n=1 Tax=Flavobacterium sp. P21 TaxID=3423948 RepID=UPI003D66EC1F